MVNRIIDLLKDGGKQSGNVYDGFYECDIYSIRQSYTVKFDFETDYQPSEIGTTDEMGLQEVIEATETIILTDISECWINDEDSTKLYPNKNQTKQIIELIEIVI